jgi:fatty-acyl-CoA synthase
MSLFKQRCARAALAGAMLATGSAWAQEIKVPARVWFVEAFPVTHSANGDKIQRANLREAALARLAETP